jgi:hypothetical protein
MVFEALVLSSIPEQNGLLENRKKSMVIRKGFSSFLSPNDQ